MQQGKTLRLGLAVALGLLLTLGGLRLAQAEPLSFQINWFSVDGGGGVSQGGGFTLRGVAGQPDAGTLTGGGYTLTGGFMLGGDGSDISGPGPDGNILYLPQVNRTQ